MRPQTPPVPPPGAIFPRTCFAHACCDLLCDSVSLLRDVVSARVQRHCLLQRWIVVRLMKAAAPTIAASRRAQMPVQSARVDSASVRPASSFSAPPWTRAHQFATHRTCRFHFAPDTQSLTQFWRCCSMWSLRRSMLPGLGRRECLHRREPRLRVHDLPTCPGRCVSALQ